MSVKQSAKEQSAQQNSAQETQSQQSTTPHLRIESRPQKIIGALYDKMPFPNIGPMQEIAFDLGITAYNGTITLTGVVIKGYADHQLLFEQRWPARVIQQRTGEADLTIAPQTGLAIRAMHFMLHGYERLSMVEVTVVGRLEEGAGAKSADKSASKTTDAIMHLPVVFPEQKTDLHFPLRGNWWAIQAADWSDQHKLEVVSQPHAIDFVKLGPDNRFFRGDGKALEDHYSWEQPVYATAGGKVAFVQYDMPDIQPGVAPNPLMFRDDPRRLLGNAVAISHANGEFSYFAHLKQASLQVNDGQLIKRGTLLGYVGNSGHSPGPNLHFHLMDGPNLFIDQGLPARFSHFSAGGEFFEQPTVIPTRMIVSCKIQHEQAKAEAE